MIRSGGSESPLFMQTDRWTVALALPDDWARLIARHGGGFFHSPAALQLDGVHDTPFFARLRCGAEVAGIAVGVLRRCRLSSRPRHAYLPTLPALDRDVAGDSALVALAATLARHGVAELDVDSYDARWLPHHIGAVRVLLRHEYLVPLGRHATAERLAERCATNHRRSIRRGERGMWTLRTLTGADAIIALAEVQRSAATRATKRGHGFAPHVPTHASMCADDTFAAPWGAATLAAFCGDALLGAALIGWAGGRAFYCVGGSTIDGYRAGASAWLHWRIMRTLAECGFSTYNLGGTAASASDPADPMHGLFRFKAGFGAEIVACRGFHRTLSPQHRRTHHLAHRLAGAFHG